MFDFTPLPELLSRYDAIGPEANFKKRFLDLLKHPQAYDRQHLPGHITGSAWVLNEARTKVLLVHHAKLNRWLQPGGHADGDQNVLAVALRELQEETGIGSPTLLVNGIFDIDIHTIPARKDFPVHDHYDVRFACVASELEPILVSEESHDVQWIDFIKLKNFTSNESVLRMLYKSEQLV